MNKYPKYKDSGIEWIGLIPQEWGTAKLRYTFDFSNGITFTKSQLVEHGNAVVSYGQIHAKTNTKTHLSDHLLRYIPDSIISGREQAKLQFGDIVFADTSEDLEGCGNAVLMDRDIPIYAGYHTIIARPSIEVCSKYQAYVFTTPMWRSQIRNKVNGVKVNSITQSILKECSILLPPFEEQEAIARFLDDKTAEIDKSIALYDTQKADLQQYRKALISHTVTRGLNPNAKLKDSGVQWIGQIPQKWEVMRGKYLLLIYSGEAIDRNNISQDGKFPIYGGGDILGFSNQTNINENTLIVGRVGARCGCVSLTNTKAWATDNALIVETKGNVRYMLYLLTAANLNRLNTSNAQPLITSTAIKEQHLPLPPLTEQQAIADYLDEKTALIDEAITKIDEQIQDLQRYRTALISEVVTGKIDITSENKK